MAQMPQTQSTISHEIAALRAMTSLLDKPDNYALNEVRIVVVCYDSQDNPATAEFDMKLSQFGLKHRTFVDDAQLLAEQAGFKGPFHCYTSEQMHDVCTDGHTALDKFNAMVNGLDNL